MTEQERTISFGIYKMFRNWLRSRPHWTPDDIATKIVAAFDSLGVEGMTRSRFEAIVASNREIIEIELDLAKQRG